VERTVLNDAIPHAGAHRRLCLIALAAGLLVPPGCGPSGPEKASVTGRVTYQGKPVPKGTITFQAVDPKGRNATGEIGPDGTYTLQTETPRDGAQLGEYKVTIYAHNEPILDYTPTTPVKPELLVPAQYENPETSGLTKTVQRGSNVFDFDLK
jgi:hypothetical protein